jgi:hypothetical protein
MGIGFAAVAALLVSLVAALIAAAILFGVVTIVTRSVRIPRRSTLIAAFTLPFICVAWVMAIFVFQALVNSTHHRDPGIGDMWECPLPNGYGLMMIDESDRAFVFNPATQGWDNVACVGDCAADVTAAQLSGRYVLGRSNPFDSQRPSASAQLPPRYFLLDTQMGKRTDFDSLDALKNEATSLGIRTELRPIEEIYNQYRYTWFDKLATALMLAPPLVAFGALVAWIIYLRRTSTIGRLRDEPRTV